MPSLQDQLLKAGLVDDKKAKQAKKAKRKQANVERRSKEVVVDEAKAAAEAARLDKIEKDRALNRQREEASQRKAIAAQIKQLIENHHKPRLDGPGEVEYNFLDGKTIKKIVVSHLVQRQLVSGILVVAKQDDAYFLVPNIVADKIAQRDESLIIQPQETTTQDAADEDDPYKDYVIPDDLMW